jgi:hypothetical protein
MASNGTTYALSQGHKEVCFRCYFLLGPRLLTIVPLKLLEKSLIDSDPEVAEIMVWRLYLYI